MPVVESESKVSVELANGSVVEILLFGANVISWSSPNIHDNDLKERFFLSKKSALDGSKPVSRRLDYSHLFRLTCASTIYYTSLQVRGGIPIVFPFFGSPTREEHKVFPSHGFGRTEKWKYDGIVSETETATSVKFGGC